MSSILLVGDSTIAAKAVGKQDTGCQARIARQDSITTEKEEFAREFLAAGDWG